MSEPVPKERLLTTQDVAELLGKSERTVEDGRRPGRYNGLPFVRVGRHIRYRRHDVEQYILGNLNTRVSS